MVRNSGAPPGDQFCRQSLHSDRAPQTEQPRPHPDRKSVRQTMNSDSKISICHHKDSTLSLTIDRSITFRQANSLRAKQKATRISCCLLTVVTRESHHKTQYFKWWISIRDTAVKRLSATYIHLVINQSIPGFSTKNKICIQTQTEAVPTRSRRRRFYVPFDNEKKTEGNFRHESSVKFSAHQRQATANFEAKIIMTATRSSLAMFAYDQTLPHLSGYHSALELETSRQSCVHSGDTCDDKTVLWFTAAV